MKLNVRLSHNRHHSITPLFRAVDNDDGNENNREEDFYEQEEDDDESGPSLQSRSSSQARKARKIDLEHHRRLSTLHLLTLIEESRMRWKA